MQGFCNVLRAAFLGTTALVAVAGAANAADLSLKDEPAMEEARKWGISFYAAGVTDYVFRGISQTSEEPTVQAAVDLTYGIAYFGIWGSGIDFGTPAAADVEIDIYAGIKPTYKNITFDIGGLYYYYPGANDAGAETDYFEAKLGASGTIYDGLSAGLTLYYSPEYSGETGEALTVEGTVSKTLPKFMMLDLVASGTLGYTDVDELGDYVYWNVGLTKTYGKFSLDVRYHDTDLDVGDNNFGCSNDDAFACDERVVGTLKVTLP
ncbi:MAG: TorF family putative porin [Hyphomicrobiales bacterium]|mgnify:CR=1 FL=1|nr:TorF family putative porin [Hyphomicrobiales bacterium]